MEEYKTKDEFYEQDKEFFRAHSVLSTGVGDLEAAAVIVTDYALASGDPGALSFFLASFADFVEAGRLPPLAMRKGFRNVIATLRRGKSKNNQTKGRPRLPLLEREWARTNANLVAHFHKSSSLDDAVEDAVALRAAELRIRTGNSDLSAPNASKSKIKRDYLNLRKLK